MINEGMIANSTGAALLSEMVDQIRKLEGAKLKPIAKFHGFVYALDGSNTFHQDFTCFVDQGYNQPCAYITKGFV